MAFLLGSLSAYGGIFVKYENSEIKFYRDNTDDITEEMKNIGTITGNSTDGFTWTINGKISEQIKIDNIQGIPFNIINDGEIIGNFSDGHYSNNGIYNEESEIKTITNNKTISVSGNGKYAINGIFNSKKIGNITNTGTILANSTDGSFSGNGIFNNGSLDIIENKNTGTISGKGSGIGSSNGIYNSSKINKIENHGTISGLGTATEDTHNNLGNGIYNNENGTIESITNSGVISGSSTGGSYSGNGIYNYQGTIRSITNSGIISGSSTSGNKNLGNGISNEKGTIGSITNSGLISGSSTSGDISGNGICNYQGTIGSITNSGIISGLDNGDGTILVVGGNNGIYNGGIIKSITNSGIISGEVAHIDVDMSFSGNGILNNNYSTIIDNIINSGIIKGKTTKLNYSGNGIYNNTGTIGDIVNRGTISGTSSEKGFFGSGIYNEDGTIGSITNSGVISGSSTGGNYSGNGIYNYNITIESITNSGVISGSSTGGNYSGNGIFNENGIIKSITNYGIIAGSNEAIKGVDENNITNFGLLINGAGTNTQKITAGVGGEQDIPVEFNDDGSIKTTEKRFIINGTGATSINSSELKNKINAGNYFNEKGYTNLLINVVGDTNTAFNINNDFSISNSTINGYKNAVALTGNTFTGNKITVNAGENAFTGSDKEDKLALSGNSVINGKIDLGEGNDKITFNTSILNGDITGDNDTIIFNESEINGNITSSSGKLIISGGENTLFNTGSSVINGNITLTDGEISVGEGTQINGKIELGGDTAVVWLGKNQLLNDKINITAGKKILGLNYNINSADEVSSMKNQINNFKNIHLADNGNSNVDLTEITGEKSIIGGNGDDTFIVSLDNLKNDISINGGKDNKGNPYNDNDTLHLTTVVDNTLSVMSFKNIMNVETLKLADVENNNAGNNLDINNSIPSVGSNLMFKNYVGGNKDDNFTVSIENFEKLSLIDGGGNGTDKGDTLKIDGFKITNIVKNDENIPIGVDKTFFGKIKNIENLELNSTLGIKLDLDGSDNGALQNLNINFGSGMLENEVSTSISKLNELKSLTGGTKRDTLIIKDVVAENETFNFMKKEDGTSKVNSIEKIKFSNESDTINLNNFDSINSGVEKIYGESGNDKFIVSSGRLNNFEDISGGDGEDFIEITDSVKNSQVLENVFVENLILKENGNEILVDDLVEVGATSIDRTRFTEITVSNDGTVEDTFTINGDKDDTERNNVILGMVIGGGSSTNDTLKVNTQISTDQLSNKTGIENLVLGNADNTIDFTYKDQDKNLEDFKNITSGNGSDHFTVSVNNIGSMKIDGGGTVVGNNGNLISKDHDILKLSGVIDNDTKGKENILNGISNVEDLELDNGENILNIDNIKRVEPNNTLGFKNIYGGNGNDTFKISAENLGKIDILKGEIQQGTNDNDRLEITSGNIDETNTNLLNKVSGVENLILADNSSNFVNLDNVSFNTITKNGTGQDNFYITSNSDKLKMTINIEKDDDYDVITIENIAVDNTETGDTEYLKNIHGVESLNLNNSNGGNKLFFNKNNINDFKFISAVQNSSITLDNLEKITVWFQGITDNELTVKNDNGIFNHEVTNASKITLDRDNKVWKFGEGSKIENSNNTVLDLNKNSLEFSEKLSLGTDGKLSFGDIGFVSSGKVTLENGNIKVGLSDNVTFDKGTSTEFTLTGGNEIAFGSALNLESYAFLNSSYDSSAKEFNITVKSWNELTNGNSDYKLFADTYDYILKEYYNQDKDTDKTITNAFNSFGTDAIAKYIETVKNHGLSKELVLNSESGTFESTVKGKVLIGTDETTKGNNDLTFKDISANDFEINVAEGTTNNISLNGAVTLNNGIDSSNSNGKINISLKENSSINLGNINFGAEKGNIDIENTSVIESIGTITNGDVTVGTADTDGFNKVLVSSNSGVENISVTEKAEIEIKNNYSGNLSFEKENNTLTLKSNENFKDYSGNIVFEKGGNTLTVAENVNANGKISVNGETNNITVDGTLSKLAFTGNTNKNNVTVNGTLESGIDFGESSYGNKVTVSENGNIGKDIIFGTEKGTDDEFTIALKDNGIFDYNVVNADVINISGVKGEIKFGENASITSNSEVTLNTKGGVIAFDINKKGDITSKNPFGNTSVKVNGDIKITLDSSVKFGSLSDTINLDLGNIKSDNIITFAFLDYKDGVISIKSADKLTGLNETSYGNYEHIILNYNNGKEYAEITEKLNTGSLSDIVSMLNGGITKGSYYFYSDQRILGEEVENQIVLGDIFVKTSEDTNKTAKDTDVTFKNITGKTAELSFAENTKNSVSFLEGTVLNKIDGSSSGAGFTLNLGDVKFTAEDNETKVTMSNFNDILNINSAINGISVNAGKGDDTVNILSSIKGIFDGNDGENTLNIGAETKTLSDENSQDEITLNGEIKNFQNINLNQNAKLESSLKIAGTNEIKLNGNSLFVDVDYNRKAEEKVIGHALYDNGIKVDNSTGKVMIDTAEAGDGTIISLGKDNKTEFTNTDKEHLLESGSSNHHIEMIDGDIVIKVNEHIMGNSETGAIKYAHLDKIYQSIVSADKIKEMSDTTTLLNKTKDEAVKAQLEFYGKIYHSTPYAYSNDVSKKSADLITESIMNLKVMPEYKHWVFGGSIAGQEADSDNNFYGSNYYNGIDIGKNEISADTNIYGAYAFGKYGIGENKSVGFALAGTRSDTDISGNSKLEGDAAYISAFAEQEMNNLKLLAGISYQHSFYDSTRNVSNDYQSMKAEKKYEDDLVSIFAGGKYSYHLGNNFFAEPNIKLSVTHIMQDSIDEGDNGELTIETDKKDFTFVEGEVGIDLVKKVNLESGTLNLRAGTSFVYLLDGYQEEYLTGRITGSSKDFEMISPEDDRAKVKITVGTEYEMTNGMFMNLHGNYTTSSHTEDYAVSFGAGYKF